MIWQELQVKCYLVRVPDAHLTEQSASGRTCRQELMLPSMWPFPVYTARSESKACHVQKRKDLSATEGHVLLLEYFEEFPLMLSHPGSTNMRLLVCCSICHVAWCELSCGVSVLLTLLTCLTNMLVKEVARHCRISGRSISGVYAQERSAVAYCPACHETLCMTQLATLDRHYQQYYATLLAAALLLLLLLPVVRFADDCAASLGLKKPSRNPEETLKNPLKKPRSSHLWLNM